MQLWDKNADHIFHVQFDDLTENIIYFQWVAKGLWMYCFNMVQCVSLSSEEKVIPYRNSYWRSSNPGVVSRPVPDKTSSAQLEGSYELYNNSRPLGAEKKLSATRKKRLTSSGSYSSFSLRCLTNIFARQHEVDCQQHQRSKPFSAESIFQQAWKKDWLQSGVTVDCRSTAWPTLSSNLNLFRQEFTQYIEV